MPHRRSGQVRPRSSWADWFVVVRDSTVETEEFHSHPTALTGYVIDGTLSIEFADGPTVLYRPGASIDVEAKVLHRCLAGPSSRLVVAVAIGSTPALVFGSEEGSNDSTAASGQSSSAEAEVSQLFDLRPSAIG